MHTHWSIVGFQGMANVYTQADIENRLKERLDATYLVSVSEQDFIFIADFVDTQKR